MEGQKIQSIKQSRRCLFISDVHLGAFSETENAKVEDDLISLINFAESEDLELFFLGDIFDYWMEIRGRIPKVGSRLLQRMKKYHDDHSRKVLFITGNHDNWTENYLINEIGFDLESEYRILDLEGKQTLLLHGDGLKNPEMKFPRPLFHRFLRNPYFIRMYKLILPPVLALWLMKTFSSISKASSSPNSPAAIRIDSWVRNQLENKYFDAIICGHSHQAKCITYNEGIYVNTGNFYSDRTVGLFADGKFQLATWVAEENVLVT